jgi:hypothetical protein
VSRRISELIVVLEEKRDAIECLQAILQQEKDLIIGLDSEGLEANSSRKLQALGKITILRDRYRNALADACRETGVSGGDALSPLIAGLKQPEKDKIAALQRTLLSTARKNERLLELNKSLLENSLSLVNRSLKFFSKFLTSGSTYGEAGRILEAQAGARLVCKEI